MKLQHPSIGQNNIDGRRHSIKLCWCSTASHPEVPGHAFRSLNIEAYNNLFQRQWQMCPQLPYNLVLFKPLVFLPFWTQLTHSVKQRKLLLTFISLYMSHHIAHKDMFPEQTRRATT
jgi:hypothetical protein